MRNGSKLGLACACLLVLFGTVSKTYAGNAQADAKEVKKTVVAIVDGQEITEEDLKIQSQLMQLKDQEYRLKMRALENAISKQVIEKVAVSKKLSTEEYFKQEVDNKIAEPTDAEIEGFYWGQKDRFREPLAKVRDQVVQGFKRAKIQDGRQLLFQKLRQQANVRIMLLPARQTVEVGSAPRKGSAAAPITIIEFSDYQCPNCKHVQGTLKQVVAKYQDKLSFVFKDFPLTNIHPQAQAAAEAAHCAGAQGKYWEYHDELFAAPSLEAGTYVELARKIKLDVDAFKTCISSNKTKALVDANFAEGQRLGISGTPAFFINGVFLSGDQPMNAFETAIDAELSRTRGGLTK